MGNERRDPSAEGAGADDDDTSGPGGAGRYRRTEESSVQYVKGVGPARAELLGRLGIETVGDLLSYFPRRYIDRAEVVPIADARLNERVTVCGRVTSRRNKRLRRGPSVVQINVADDTGEIQATWFNQPYMFDAFSGDQRLLLTGKVTFYDRLQIVSPEYEILDEEADQPESTGIMPVYTLTEGLSQRQMRRIVANALDAHAARAEEIFPPKTREGVGLLGLSAALRQIHYPSDTAALARARTRFKYEELFLLQVGMALRRRMLRAAVHGSRMEITARIDARIRRIFPFKLTAAQERVIGEIRRDLSSDNPMNRLLQGDVGCGKTAVAVYAILAAVANKCQVALMAPTEILAEQHYKTLATLLAGARVRMALLAGGLPKGERAAVLTEIAEGRCDIIIGTHALIQQDVAFRKLGLVVVDEQHKFGVVQRGALRDKGLFPAVLVMTATPIPRTLSLTVFGDLDVSIIDEMPPGRGLVRTFLADSGDADRRRRAISFVARRLARGEQAFFVYPLVEGSERAGSTADIKSARAMAQTLGRGPLGRWGVRLIHGRMKAHEKDRIMAEFRAGTFRVLVATVVIEVGIDVPSATVMVIENAERFGLSQLHQLRGRIGRGTAESFCILLGDASTEEARSRLSTIAATTDGFKIAEEDLRLRGPGQFFGTRQHGLPELKVADLIEDYDLLIRARGDAVRLVDDAPRLKAAAWAGVKRAVFDKYGEVLELVDVG